MAKKPKSKYKPGERDPKHEYALYSDDDGVEMFENENDAIVTRRAWINAAANDVRGPFKLFRSTLDQAAPALLDSTQTLMDFLSEAHAYEREEGEGHEDVCSYCEAIDKADKILRKLGHR